MAVPTRQEMQDKINEISLGQPIKQADLKPQLFAWLDGQDLTSDNLSHEFVRDHILDDLNSYEGVTD